MKVSDRKAIRNPEVGGPQGVADGVRGGRAEGVENPTGDSVEVSPAARALARLVEGGEIDAAPVRPEKVEPLKAAVAGGTYRVDAEATARAFLREVLGDLVR
ncbi:MAG: flagellar biosynthesis anti-sigma factor FlgM [bacterium]|nr:flagellar biosynthesis anti-sigma factor FlgM [bacterium]